MLLETLDDCIIDMDTVKQLETISTDIKQQAEADYKLKLFITVLAEKIDEVQIAVSVSEFKPSPSTINMLNRIVGLCYKAIEESAAHDSIMSYLNLEFKKACDALVLEWGTYYNNTTKSVLNLLETIKVIISDKSALYAINKLKRAFSWNVNNFKYLQEGLGEAKHIIEQLSLDENVEEFLRLVGGGKATVQNLTPEIMEWINGKQFAGKLSIQFIS